MKTVLVIPTTLDGLVREPWELEGWADPHVDAVTDNLPALLRHLVA